MDTLIAIAIAITAINKLNDAMRQIKNDTSVDQEEKLILLQTIEKYQNATRANNIIKESLIRSLITEANTTSRKLVGVFNPETEKFQFVYMNPESSNELNIYFKNEKPTTKVIPGNHNLRVISIGSNIKYKENTLALHTLDCLYRLYPDNLLKKEFPIWTKISPNNSSTIYPNSGYVLVYSDTNNITELQKLMQALYNEMS